MDGLENILNTADAMHEKEQEVKETKEQAAPSLAEIIGEVDTILDRYIVFPEKGLSALVSVWIAGTYCYECFQYFGYLALRSATPRCGKTRLLRLISLFANGNPPITAIPTAATMFRSTEPVLILDEVDKMRNQDKETYGEVLAVLNAGFEAGAVIRRLKRVKGEGYVTGEYPVYGPKALAGIEGLADTLSDRSFQIGMKRSTQRTPRLNVRKLKNQSDAIRKKLEVWASQHMEKIQTSYEKLPDEVEQLAGWDDRFQDIAEPLLILAVFADAQAGNGSGIVKRLIQGLQAAAGRREPSSRERDLLSILEILKERIGEASELFISSSDLLSICQTLEDLSYLENTRKLARFLKNFDIFPGRNPAGNLRGYLFTKGWIKEWSERYKN